MTMDPRTSAQDVMQCDLCETTLVQMSCDTCCVNLCKTCMGEHFSTGPSKPHKFIRIQERKSSPVHPRCTSHDKERCEMYCNQCHIPVCHTCLASDQHLGHKFLKILQVFKEKKEKIAKVKNELSETIHPAYQGIISDIQNRMSQLEMKHEDLSTSITKHGKNLYREINKLVQKLKAEAEQMKSKQVHILQKHLDEMFKKNSYINDEINSMDVALDSNDMSKVFSVRSKVDEYKILPQKMLSSLPNFTPRKIQEKELCKLFGSLSSISVGSEEYGYNIKTTQKCPEAASSPVIKQLLDEPHTVTAIHTGYKHNIYNVACLSDEYIWVCRNNTTMKLFSINQGSLFKSITTKSWNIPTDIAVSNSGNLVYTDETDKTVNIVNNEEIQTMITLQNWKPRGVCSTTSGDLLVIMISDDDKQSKVARYSGSTETQTIQFDDHGRFLYSPGSNNKYISENRNLDICVTDYKAKAVVVVNRAGKLKFRYTGHTPAPRNRPFNPQGIATDSQSHILTADYFNHCVHIINQDGQFLRYIECRLREPWGLCIDTNDNLFVAQCYNKIVNKIKYQQ